ncbi:MAG: RNA methyltransferase [Nitrospirae bacterium]|nr:RNA methyltransferase [Nitrospirota bacterium]
MADRLTSTANPRVRWVKGLHQARQRRAEGVAVAEGIKAVAELAADPARVVAVFWSETCAGRPEGTALLDALGRAGVPLTEVAPHVLDAMADTRTPQGVIAVVRCAPADLEALLARPGDVLVLDGVQDPGNVGALLRSAAAAGAAGVVLAGGCADPTQPKAVRSAAGCLLRLPFVAWHDAPEVLADRLKAAGCRLAVARADGAEPPARVAAAGRVAWVLGAEGGGVCAGLRARADVSVAIPMAAGVESLNVAVAGSLLLFARALAEGG